MKTFLATILSSFLLVGMIVSFSHGNPATLPIGVEDQFIAGTIERVDTASLRLTIQTDLGGTQSLTVANADIIKGLSKGDQVSVELDERGRVMKVVKTMQNPRDVPEPKS